MYTVGGLMGYNDIWFHRLEEIVHLVLPVICTNTGPVGDHVFLGYTGGEHVGPPVPGNFQVFKLVPVYVEVPFMKGRVLEVHVVIPGKGVNCCLGFQVEEVFKYHLKTSST